MIPDAADLGRYLVGLDYPSDRGGVLENARRRGADHDVLHYLESLPNRTYEGPDSIRAAYLIPVTPARW
jgi:hypothetical protein